MTYYKSQDSAIITVSISRAEDTKIVFPLIPFSLIQFE